MPLSNASDSPSSDFDSFPDSPDPYSGSGSDSSSDSPAIYPPPPSLAPFSSFFGYSPSDRARYIGVQSTNTSRLLNLNPTPAESAALAYYDSIFYTYESYGDVLGTSTGALIAFLFRNRRPGPFATGLSRALGQASNPKAARLISTTFKFLVIGAAGRLYGLTSAGIQALNRIRTEQRTDPIMARIVAARARRTSTQELDTKRKAFSYPRVQQRQQEDEQSLGGMETADVKRRSDEAEVEAESRAFPFGRPSEKVAELEAREPERGEDPFFEEGQKEGPVQTGWRNKHSGTAESAWERLRKGQVDTPDRTSSWVGRVDEEKEPKTDSFSFSKTVEERELAKAQAQKEFDESVERERRSGAGDGYSEGDKGGRGWRD